MCHKSAMNEPNFPTHELKGKIPYIFALGSVVQMRANPITRPSSAWIFRSLG
jgi:hypothetical protein